MSSRDTAQQGNSRSGRGDRVVQIVLLVLIGLGIVGIPLILLGGGPASAGPGAGGPPGSFPGGAGDSAGDPTEKAAAVRVAEAALGDVREFIRVNGDVEAGSSVNLYPDTSGKLVSVAVAPGDGVRRGQTVAVVDPSLPGQVYGRSAVTSTITGTVTAVNIDVGETVGTSSPIVTVGDLSTLEIVTYVPERYVGSVSAGMEAEVVLDAYPDEIFRARVTEMSPVLDLSSRSQEISLSLLDADPRVKAGMFASTRIVIRQSLGAVTVSPAALTTFYDRDVVFVVNDGTAERREVTVGLSSSEAVEIIDGLDAGEMVVIQGLSGISDGSRVRIVD